MGLSTICIKVSVQKASSGSRLLTISKLADLGVLFLQLLADLLGGQVERHRLGDGLNHTGRSVRGRSKIIALRKSQAMHSDDVVATHSGNSHQSGTLGRGVVVD
eukprot:1393545-Amorphochlora_amoeboformis.AAC.1